MLTALIYFLIGVLVLLVVLYVTKLVLDYLELPPPIRQIVMLIFGLIGLIVLIILVMGVLPAGSLGRL